MNTKGLGFGGAALLIVGLFVPVIRFPMVGNVNLFGNGTNPVALVLIVLAALSAVLLAKNWGRAVIWPAVASLVLLLYVFGRFEYTIWQMRQSLRNLADNPFASIAQGAVSAVQLQWGWLVLGAGAGLLVYAAATARRVESQSSLSPSANWMRGLAALSLLLLLVTPGLDLAAALRPKPKIDPNTVTSTTVASTNSTSSDSTKAGPTAEELAYINQHLHVYDLRAKYFEGYDGRVPGVRFKIKNDGDRTLNGVTVRVVFYDANNKAIAEEEYNPVMVSQYNFTGDNTPLRPNYIWQQEPDKFYAAKSVPSEWQTGKASASITAIEFAPN